MAPSGTKNDHARAARTACVIRMLSDIRRAGLMASSFPVSSVPGCELEPGDEATIGIAATNTAASSDCNIFVICIRTKLQFMDSGCSKISLQKCVNEMNSPSCKEFLRQRNERNENRYILAPSFSYRDAISYASAASIFVSPCPSIEEMPCFLIAAEPADIPHQSRTPSFYEYTRLTIR